MSQSDLSPTDVASEAAGRDGAFVVESRGDRISRDLGGFSVFDKCSIAVAIVCWLALAIGAFMLGSMEGDLPHPPTDLELLIYSTGGLFTKIGAIALALLAVIVSVVAVRRFPAGDARGLRVTGSILAFALGGVMCFAVYFLALYNFVGALT